MFGTSIRVLALIEAESVTGPAKNLIDFAERARDAGNSLSRPRSVEISIATFQRVRGDMAMRVGRLNPDPSRSGVRSTQFIGAARSSGIEVNVIWERFRLDSRVVTGLKDLVKRIQPDVLQTHNVKSHFLLRASGLAREYPWIAFHHGYTATDAKMCIYNQLDRWSLRGARRIITVSSAYAGQLEAIGIAANKIRVVPNAIDRESFHEHTQPEVGTLRERLGLSVAGRMILAVGRLSAEKGHVHLVRAVARLCREHPEHDARVVIVGSGPEASRLVRTAKSLGLGDRLILTGHVEDTRAYYLAADVMVLPSLAEGSPNALLEAMAAGLPLVATRVGGVPEMIRNGASGLLVDAKDSQALSAAVHRLLSDKDLSRKVAETARSNVTAYYSPVTRMRSLIDIYGEVMRGKSQAHLQAAGAL